MRPNIIFLFFIIYLTDLNFFHTTAAKKSALLRRIIVYIYGKLLKQPYTRRARGTTIALNMYASAVLVSGLVGFGLGATPNAMANMSAVCLKYRYADLPNAMFVDIINTGIITLFLNLV